MPSSSYSIEKEKSLDSSLLKCAMKEQEDERQTELMDEIQQTIDSTVTVENPHIALQSSKDETTVIPSSSSRGSNQRCTLRKRNTNDSCTVEQEQPPPPSQPDILPNEESYPTPIISNRGVLGSPSQDNERLLLPLQLPAAVTEDWHKTDDGGSASWVQSSSTATSMHARFSSLNEPPIHCNWPQPPLSEPVPRQISIPRLSQPNEDNNVVSTTATTTPVMTISTHMRTATSTTTTTTLMQPQHVIFRILPTVTDGGSWVRLILYIVRFAALGVLPRLPSSSFLFIPGIADSSTTHETRQQRLKQRQKTSAAATPTTIESTLIHSKKTYQNRKSRTMATGARHSPSQSVATPSKLLGGDGIVQGLPSFGQTCFMNATIQALASLDAFPIYLKHVVHLVETEHNRQTNSFTSATTMTMTTSTSSCLVPDNGRNRTSGHDTWYLPSTSVIAGLGQSKRKEKTIPSCQENVSRLLLDILLKVNGTMSSSMHSSSFSSVSSSRNYILDTRPLLRKVGKEHAQFATMGAEQQDAQEFLTVLLDSVVTEAEITSSSFLYPNSFIGCLPEPISTLSLLWEEDEDDVLTVVSGSKERQKQDIGRRSSSSPRKAITTTLTMTTTEDTKDSDSSNFVSSTDVPLVGILPSASPNEGLPILTSPTSSHQSVGKESVSTSSDDGREENLNDHHQHDFHNQRHYHNGVHMRPEEKKQEDFEIHIPKVASEEDLLASCQSPPVPHVVDHGRLHMDDPSLSDVSSYKERPLPRSTSLEIMRTTTTPLSPSPLTGWMGSSLQCRRCGHVRPIRNAPFGDWSVSPTCVSDGILSSGSKMTHQAQACRLEECLAEYVRVEHVTEVECRYCTLQREREKMVEEIEMTEAVIQGLLAKAQRRRASAESHCTALRQELNEYRSKLHRLQRIDADDDQPIFLPPDGDDNATTPPLMRTSARKCMFLTRLPAILCIHVQRRYYDPVVDRMTKLTQHVIFPEILDVAPYCAYSGVLGGNWAGSDGSGMPPKHRPDAKAIPYRLQSVMEHRGGAFSGHYVCYRRDKTNGGWLYISDHLVRPVSWRDVQRCQAYMLFYEAI